MGWLGAVAEIRPERPYLESWLRRIGRQLAVSGRLSQTAQLLAAEDGGSPDEWRSRLRRMLDGGEPPTMECITRIDRLLSGIRRDDRPDHDDMQGRLF